MTDMTFMKRYGDSGQPCLMPMCCFLYSDLQSKQAKPSVAAGALSSDEVRHRLVELRDGRSVHNLRLKDLRNLLQEKGLDTYGLRNDLIERALEWVGTQEGWHGEGGRDKFCG